MTSQVVPSHFQPGLKAPGARIRSYEAQFPSTNDTYAVSSSNTIRIEIPQLSPGTFLDPLQSYVKLSIAVAGAAAQLDFSAACVIRRLTVSSSSLGTQLEVIDRYNVLSNLLLSLTTEINCANYSLSTLIGTSETLNEPRQGATIAAGSSRTFCLPLMSILGLFAERNIPCTGFTLELQLEDTAQAFISASAVTATISQVSYCASLHDVGPQLYGAMTAASGGTLMVPCSSYRAFQATTSLSSNQSFPLGIRQSSVKHALVTMRRNDSSLTTTTTRSLSDTQSLGLTSYIWRIGAENVPSNPVTGFAQQWAQLQKALHVYNTSLPGMIRYTQYIRDAAFSTAAATVFGGWCLGTDFEPSAWQKSHTMLSGLSTSNNVNVYLDCTWSTAPTVTATLDAFFAYDIVLAVNGNQVTASA
jgi:hypothetical protein